MTVRELIEALQQRQPPDARVLLPGDLGYVEHLRVETAFVSHHPTARHWGDRWRTVTSRHRRAMRVALIVGDES